MAAPTQPPGYDPNVNGAIKSGAGASAQAAAKTGQIATEHGTAAAPDAGILRNFMGSIHGHALVSGMTQTAPANLLNPSISGGIAGLSTGKKLMNPFGFRT